MKSTRLLAAMIVHSFLTTVLVVGAADAGEIEPSFAAKLRANALQTHRAIVYMRDQVDMIALDRDLDRMAAPRKVRHEIVVDRLRSTASETQGPMRDVLAGLRVRGLVQSADAVWIVNAFLIEARADAIAWIASHPDVQIVYEDWGVEPIAEFENYGPTTPVAAAGPEPGIVGMRATDLWAMGLRGQGRIVANLDTGVDGTHPALAPNWRGNQPGVTAAEAWLDPSGSRPNQPYAATSHGTHVMGTVCGSDGANEIGVAPGAHWIAALWRWTGGNPQPQFVSDCIRAFQWFADPDRDPKTVDDVPDAVCNSWGLIPTVASHQTTPCDPLFWNAIDNCEYSGVAVIFAAGNESTRGLRTPADRIANPVSTFSIGALRADHQTIASFSSRGPSKCDNQTIKPEICAHGELVRSSLPNGRYGSLSGTSMATPHIAGGVALLRQAWPDVTSRRVKELMLETADDLGPTGDDNTFGMGRVNLLSAHTKLIAERPVVAMSVVGVVRKVKEGTSAYARVFLTNYTAQKQSVRLGLVLTYNGGTTPMMFLPPTDVDVPANFTNAALPLFLDLPVPAGLGAIVLEPNTWSIRATVEPKGGGTALHSSEYEFVVTL